MRADPDGVLLGASFAFAGASVLGSVVAIRDQLPGEPLGVSIPLSVPAGLLAGWGAAVAAPWPMPVAAVTITSLDSACARRGARGDLVAIASSCHIGLPLQTSARLFGVTIHRVRRTR